MSLLLRVLLPAAASPDPSSALFGDELKEAVAPESPKSASRLEATVIDPRSLFAH